jgi:hypothetical protein
MKITIEDIDESEIHQGKEIQSVQHSFDAKHWWQNGDEGAKDIIDVPMYGKYKRYVYTDGSVSLPILSIEVINNEE